jgi:hypothetical protein
MGVLRQHESSATHAIPKGFARDKPSKIVALDA